MRVIILRGPSGSGKSTYIKKNYPKAQVFSADHFFNRNGKYVFDPAKLGEAHAICLKLFVFQIQHNRTIADNPREGPMESDIPDIVVDNTNTTVAEIAPYAALALAYGYEMEIVTLVVPFQVAAARNVHGVPLNTVRDQCVRIVEEGARIPKWWPHRKVSNG